MGNFQEQNNPHFSPAYPFKIEVFAVSYEGNWTAAQHCKEGVQKEKLYFPLFKILWQNVRKAI